MIKEKITALVKKDDKANKKKIENLVFAIIVLLVTLYAINNIFKGKEKQNVSNNIRTQEAEEKTIHRKVIAKSPKTVKEK